MELSASWVSFRCLSRRLARLRKEGCLMVKKPTSSLCEDGACRSLMEVL
jgi:hypothetical protein